MESNSSNCFSYQQLANFVTNEMNSSEQLLFQQHLLKCDLCRYAVKGFELIAFNERDIADMNKKIDKSISKEKINAESFKYACLAGVLTVLIFSFYTFVNSFSNKTTNTSSPPLAVITQPIIKNKENTRTTASVIVEKIKKRIPNLSVIKNERKTAHELNSIEPIKTNINERIRHNNEIKLELRSIANAVYIYNLKVANYFNLYFESTGIKTINVNHHTPSFKENKNLNNLLDNEINTSITLDKMLKNGLFYFSEENYTNAINEFQKLLAHSSDDINALFYTAMAYNKSGNYQKATVHFNSVLKHTDKTFYDEAKWYLAKTYILMQKTDVAKKLFIEIEAENGFYAKDAKKELSLIN